MRVLLDECLPRRLKKYLPGHDVKTVPEAGLAGTENGDLLALIPGRFDAFVTIDQKIAREHDLAAAPFGVVVLRARSNRLADLRPLAARILDALGTLQPGQVAFCG